MSKNFLRHSATYGLIIGLALVILSLIDYVLGLYGQNKLFKLLSYVIMAGGIVYAAIHYRNREMGGFITYGQVVSYGLLTSVFFGIVTAVFSVLLITVIDPSYIDKVLDIAVQQLYEQGYTEQQIDMALDMSRRFSTPVFTFIGGIISSVIMGLILSLIAAIFVKRNNPNAIFNTNQW
jgi:hypothetical protein